MVFVACNSSMTTPKNNAEQKPKWKVQMKSPSKRSLQTPVTRSDECERAFRYRTDNMPVAAPTATFATAQTTLYVQVWRVGSMVRSTRLFQRVLTLGLLSCHCPGNWTLVFTSHHRWPLSSPLPPNICCCLQKNATEWRRWACSAFPVLSLQCPAVQRCFRTWAAAVPLSVTLQKQKLRRLVR